MATQWRTGAELAPTRPAASADRGGLRRALARIGASVGALLRARCDACAAARGECQQCYEERQW